MVFRFCIERDGARLFSLEKKTRGKGWARLFPLEKKTRGKRRGRLFSLEKKVRGKRRAPSLSIQNRKTNPFLLEKNVKKKIHQL